MAGSGRRRWRQAVAVARACAARSDGCAPADGGRRVHSLVVAAAVARGGWPRGTRRCPTMGQAKPVVGGSARRRHVLATRARACAARSEGCAAADGRRRAALVAMDRGGQLARAASGRLRRWWATQRWIVRCWWPGGGARRRAGSCGGVCRRRTCVRSCGRRAAGGVRCRWRRGRARLAPGPWIRQASRPRLATIGEQ